MKIRAVPIHAVAEIPVTMFGQAIEEPGVVTFLSRAVEENFHGGGEEFPVVFASRDGPRRFEGGDDVALDARVEFFPKLGRRTQQRLRKERGIHQRLGAFGEIHEVGRRGIGGGVEAGAGERGEAGTLDALGCGVGAKFKPGGESAEEASEPFEMGVKGTVLRTRSRLDRHGRFEAARGESGEQRRGQPTGEPDPDGAVCGAGGDRGVGGVGQRGTGAGGRKDEGGRTGQLQEVPAGTRVGKRRPSNRMQRPVIRHDPTARGELRVDLLAGELFRGVRHGRRCGGSQRRGLWCGA